MKREFLDFVKELEGMGYRRSRIKGSHYIYVHQTSGHVISVNKDLNKMVAKRLRKEMNNYAECDD